MILVVDANVALKWFFRAADDETDAASALEVLDGVASGGIELVQPPHFIAEIAAVLVRKKPTGALDDLRDLQDISMRTAGGPDLHLVAAEIALRTRAHVFDTLYQATALLNPPAEFVTADRRYYRCARHLGQIRLLAEAG
jgi:predicted nucleic acid-binding protein